MTATPTVALVHGLAIRLDPARMFTGVRNRLESQGFRVVQPLVRGDGSIDGLAARLRTELSDQPGPLVLLCHSMGGLWARRLLLDDLFSQRIRAVATVGTAHAGTPHAVLLSPFGRAYRDMTPAARAARNAADGPAEDAAAARHGIARLSLIARARHWPDFALRAAGWVLRAAGADAGDGLVPAASQRWGTVLGEVDLDHEAAVRLEGHGGEDAIGLWSRLARAAVQASPSSAAS